ncbi:MAG: aminoglycoside phosphotransferase family protein [Gemmatimonadota bacterium]|nr:aminoglycoside phosphotransferase family protein [Gemmatimonadota bacterium]
MIPDLTALKARFLQLLDTSGAFSPTEREEGLRMMFSGKGYEWPFFCPMYPSKKALLIPAPWSMTPLVLCDRFAELVVWEPERRRAELLDRFLVGSLGLPIRVIGAPLHRLAAHSEQYSLVAFEDTFAQRPGSCPKDVVRSAVRLLEDDGQCCVVTANRFGRSNLKDALRSLTRKFKRGARPGDTLPSLSGIRRELRGASLVHQRTYSFYPDHRQPREILGWNGHLPHHVRAKFRRPLHRLGFQAGLHDGFMVIAGRQQSAWGFVDQLLTHLRDELRLGALPAVDECRVQRTGVLMFFLNLHDHGKAVLRVPIHHKGALRMDASRRVLALLAARAPQISSFAPEQLAHGALGRTPYALEGRLPGVTGDQVIARSGTDRGIMDEAFHFLEQLSLVHCQRRQVDEAFGTRHFRPVFATLHRYYPEVSPALKDIEAFLVRSTRGQQIPLIWVHGDFNIRNVLLEPSARRLTGVIDWDSSKEFGLPLQDLLHFILSMHRRRTGMCLGHAVAHALEGELLVARERSLLDGYCDLLGLEETLVTPLLMLYWAEHIAGHFVSGGPERREAWHEENFFEPLRSIRCLTK